MKKLLIFYLLILFIPAFGQTDKDVESAVKTFNSGDVDKGIKMMKKVISKSNTDNNWDMLIEMYYYRYENTKDELSKGLIESLAGEKNVIKLNSSNYFNELIAECKEASLYSQGVKASLMLRGYLIDYKPDTAINAEALKEFNIAEEYFGKKDYLNAKIHNQNALVLQPNFYMATIYLGDSYWYLNKLDSAIFYFQKWIKMYPDLLEPRKYLVDALATSKRNEEAKTECFNAIFIFPDQSMFLKYNDLIKRDGKKFNKHWLPRGCEINSINKVSKEAENLNWKLYQKAVDQIRPFCNNNGIISSNTLTKSKYLEVYSWEKMLKDSKTLSKDFDFAKKMLDEGYLDCYVFISLFHYDLNGQYQNFIKDNKQKVRTYFEKYLTE